MSSAVLERGWPRVRSVILLNVLSSKKLILLRKQNRSPALEEPLLGTQNVGRSGMAYSRSAQHRASVQLVLTPKELGLTTSKNESSGFGAIHTQTAARKDALQA